MALGAPAFLRLSLRTEILSEAMRRASALVAAMQMIEDDVMSACVTRLVQPEEVRAMVTEAVRRAVLKLQLAEAEAGPRDAGEADAALARIEASLAELRDGLRRRDHAAGVAAAEEAAAALGMHPALATAEAVRREVMGGLIETCEAARAVELGATLSAATRTLRAERFGGRTVDKLPTPVMLSAAIRKSVEDAVSTDMANKQAGTGELMLAYNGDVPVEMALAAERRLACMNWMKTLPRDHGVKHGKNRYNSVGNDVSKHETDATVEHHHGRMKAIHHAAVALGWSGGSWTSVLKAWKTAAKREDNRATDPLKLRVTQRKNRVSWRDECIAMLLTSTNFSGCSTEHRRWKPGNVIIRDALYWVPLFCLFCGVRPEEALKLLKTDVMFRNHVLCIRIEETPDGSVKTDSSEPTCRCPRCCCVSGLPGMVERGARETGEALFPEIPISESLRRCSDIFGKRRGRVFSAWDCAISTKTSTR